jgi:lysophospholipase L1-like esterase
MGVGAGFVFLDLIVFWWDQRHPAPLARAAQREPIIYELTPEGSYRLRRFLDKSITDPISNVPTHIRTNALGYRGGPVGPKEPGEFRILALGDSITLSAYTQEHETYPAILEGLLGNSGGNVRVLNAGISGAGLREELLVLHETGLLTQPDLVIVGLFLNDATRSRMFRIPEGLLAHSAIARRFAENQYVEEALAESRREYERLSGRPSPTETFAELAWRNDRAAFEKKIAEGAADWGRGFYAWAWAEMRPDLDIMRALAAEHGFELLVVLFPATIQWEANFVDDRPQRHFENLMKELGLRHFDLLPVMRAAYQRDRRSLSFDHGHLRPEGNRVAAEAIAAFLEQWGLLPSATSQPSTADRRP